MKLDPIIDDLLERASADAASHRVPRLIGVSGIDCSGKSLLASAMAEALALRSVRHAVLSTDDFLWQRSVRNRNHDQAFGYYEETFDFETLFARLLRPLKAEGSLRKTVRTFDWIQDVEEEREFVIEPHTVVIVEGVFLFRQPYRDVFDHRIWIDVSFDAALARALHRTRDLEYYPSPEAIQKRYTDRFFKGQRLHIDADRPQDSCEIVLQ